MNKPQHMILEYASRMYIPLDYLSAPNITDMFNCPSHGLTPPQLLNALRGMFDDGDLVASYWTNHERASDWFSPSEEEIKAGLNGKSYLCYAMTPQGGGRWEKASKADWSLLVVTIMNVSADLQEVTTESLDAKMIEKQMVMRGIQSNFYIDLRTAVWDIVAPWKATYWKTLPESHRLTVKGCQRDGRREPARESFFNHFCRAYQDWYSEEPRWYTPPWRT